MIEKCKIDSKIPIVLFPLFCVYDVEFLSALFLKHLRMMKKKKDKEPKELHYCAVCRSFDSARRGIF